MEQRNQIHCNVHSRREYTVHEMVVDGVILRYSREQRPLITLTILTHSRWIGDKKYVVEQTVLDGEVRGETVVTNLKDDEIENFLQEWEEKWQPSLSQWS